MTTRAVIKPEARRCAVYTRKSSDEGLEQSFNSLHAQREACEAYVLSQTGEGWTALAGEYDDGGFSGGNMDRPGLQRLLGEVDAGRVDIVVVYKVDRLTRSLADFAKIVERLDAAGVSFVSVTQAFNTTTSMGRLTLNVLLSFAQFEREVTGERIRDKIAASKVKGMWMGGVLPLGFDSCDHRLVANPAEAAQVQAIFERYLKMGSVHALCDALKREGVRSKSWVTRAGRPMGGQVFSRGALFHLLQNRHYVGEICHGKKTYPGQHAGIVDPKLFEAVQRKLARNRVKRRERPRRADAARLTGRLFDVDGHPYTSSFSYGRRGKPYAYYVRTDLQTGVRGVIQSEAPLRVPLGELEATVIAALGRVVGRPREDWSKLSPLLRRIEIRAEEIRLTLSADGVFKGDHPELGMKDLIDRLEPGERAVMHGSPPNVIVAVPGRASYRGGRTWRSGPRARTHIDPVLVNALKSAHRALAEAGLALAADVADASGARTRKPLRAKAMRIGVFGCRSFRTPSSRGVNLGSLTLGRLLSLDLPLTAWEDQIRLLRTDLQTTGCLDVADRACKAAAAALKLTLALRTGIPACGVLTAIDQMQGFALTPGRSARNAKIRQWLRESSGSRNAHRLPLRASEEPMTCRDWAQRAHLGRLSIHSQSQVRRTGGRGGQSLPELRSRPAELLPAARTAGPKR